MNVVMDPHCKGCAYLGYAGGGYTCCDYLFKENRRRPCPPGKDCTVKITPKQKEMLDKQRKKESKRVVMGACQWCGAEFIQVSNGSKKYCGKKCCDAANAAKKRQRKEAARAQATEKEMIVDGQGKEDPR